jgi:hypothetical protein
MLFAVALYFSFKTFPIAPSCTDGRQDGNETGIDCGGSCAYICSDTVTVPVVRFARPLSPAAGRTDVIAYVDNPNAGVAAQDVSYRIDLYGADNVLVSSKTGSVDLPPRGTVPVFVPNFSSGYQAATRAFLTIATTTIHWYAYTGTRIIPSVGNYSLSNADTAPSISVPLTNPSAEPLYDVKVVATVFDAKGNAIAASQTLLASIPAQGSQTATFTWNAPFSAPVARVDILPVISL